MEIFPLNAQQTLLVSGAIDDWQTVRDHAVYAIVDMDGDVDTGVPEAPGEILYIYFPIADEELPHLHRLDALGRLLAALVEARQVVLIHCLLGMNRSNLLPALALTYLGITGEEALTVLRRAQAGALFNDNFASFVVTLPAKRLRLELLVPPEASV
jgi:protein-tyrosine phosphatase